MQEELLRLVGVRLSPNSSSPECRIRLLRMQLGISGEGINVMVQGKA